MPLLDTLKLSPLAFPRNPYHRLLKHYKDGGIALISPEQLRSSIVRKTLEQREVGLWVLDEAHCLSRWGHDFRPDYRYIAKFINRTT